MDEETARAHAMEIFRGRLADLLDAGYMLRREDDDEAEASVAAFRGSERPTHLRVVNDREARQTTGLDGGFSRHERKFSLFKVTLRGGVVAEVFYKRTTVAK